MEIKRNITVTLEKARKWYCSKNETLNELALQAFSENELCAYDFTQIKNFEDALTFLLYSESTKAYIRNTINDISIYSKASAAMAKLNIIKKALNVGQGLRFTRNPYHSLIYYPTNQFITEYSTDYRDKIYNGEVEVIGKIKCGVRKYDVIGGEVSYGSNYGLSSSDFYGDTASANASIAFLGCASEEIAKYFGKQFGMLITEAKFGDLPGFEIIQ